ncbi:MarR family winged helix-turn-helix transcriptional regulator [Methylobacterium nigriterrae]|uniref:MarR family winged helix-turn-helix transcriptional regulator n=1 Tax=Methylobacterium nigriterrae TaxID=3127512 RepID=UPI0030132F6A
MEDGSAGASPEAGAPAGGSSPPAPAVPPVPAASSPPVPAAPWPLAERPGFLIRRLHQIHGSLFSERCAEFRITPLQYSLLSLLFEQGEADQTTLANAVALDRTTTTGALKRLEARGFVSRTTSTADRRAQQCGLTPEGRALHAAMEAAARQAHEATLAALAPAERRSLVRLMKKLTAAHGDRRGAADLL